MPYHDAKSVNNYISLLKRIDAELIPLPGLLDGDHYDCLSRQIIDSVRRREFIFYIRDTRLSELRMDPSSSIFDPLRAASLHLRAGRTDEAYWLVFLATHFGKHAEDGWQLTSMVYGKLGQGCWNWHNSYNDPVGLGQWLDNNATQLSTARFSNHRKYESLKSGGLNATAAVLKSYIDWIKGHGSHNDLIRALHTKVGQNPTEVFDALYSSMKQVKRFGRLGRFDFLTMLEKLGISPITPGSAYLWHRDTGEATGPAKGARLLFSENIDEAIKAGELDGMLVKIDTILNVGMQVLEDSICNWQKSPDQYLYFRG